MRIGLCGLPFEWQADNTDFVKDFASEDEASPVMKLSFADAMPEGYGIQYADTPTSHLLRLSGGELLCAADDWSEATVYFDNDNSEYALPLAAVCSRLAYFGGLLFHASCVELDGEGVVFAGFSGAGKTTQARLWKEYLGAEIINGDKVLVRLAEGEVLAYGLPWKGSSEYCLNRRTRLKAIVIPMHSSVNKITRLDTLGIVEKLMPHVFLPHWDKRCLELALSAFDTLQTEISVWLLECRPDKEAVKLTYGTVFDK